MDEKISLEAIALYGDAYAENVLKSFLAAGENYGTGDSYALQCATGQSFVIRELFRAWKEETRKLKSPYFDYDHTEVKEALDNFINTLSQNIAIHRTHFAPLLKKATSQALLVIFDPYDFYSMMITGKNNKLEVEPFREEIKYLKVNKAPLERMLNKLDEKGVKEISGNEAFGVLDIILEEVNFTPEDVDVYIEKFSAVAPLDPSKFYVAKSPIVETPAVVAPKQPEVIVHELTPEPVKIELKPEPVKPEPVKPEPIKVEPVKINQPKANVPRQNHVVTETTVVQKPTVVQNLAKIARIKDSLTINQKFMFTKVLFHGDFDLFSKAIERLDQFDHIQAAMRYIEDEYASTWDHDSEEFHEFMELVERRFA